MGKNALWLLGGRIGGQALMVIFIGVVARRMGTAGFGAYTFIVSVFFLANVMTTFGTDMYLLREVAARADLDVIPAVIAVQLALSIPAIGLVFLLPNQIFGLTPAGVSALRLYSFALFPSAVSGSLNAVLRGVERMDTLTWLNLITMGVQVGAVLLFLNITDGIVHLAIILLAVQTFSAIVTILFCWRIVDGFWQIGRVSWQKLRETISGSSGIVILGILGIFYQRLLIYLSLPLMGAEQTGLLSAAMKVVEIPKVGHYAIMGAILPLMTRMGSRENTTHRLFAYSFWILLAGSGLAVVLLYLFAEPIIGVFFGEGFEASVGGLRIMVWGLIPFTITNYISLRIFSAGYEKRMILPLTVSIGLMLVAGILSLQGWGLIGGAGVIVGVEMILALSYLFVWDRLEINKRDADALS